MYIPIVVAMAAKQNVLGALEGGPLALFAGIGAVVASFLLVLCCAPSMGASVDTALALTAVLLLTSSFAIDLAAWIRTKEPALR